MVAGYAGLFEQQLARGMSVSTQLHWSRSGQRRGCQSLVCCSAYPYLTIHLTREATALIPSHPLNLPLTCLNGLTMATWSATTFGRCFGTPDARSVHWSICQACPSFKMRLQVLGNAASCGL